MRIMFSYIFNWMKVEIVLNSKLPITQLNEQSS